MFEAGVVIFFRQMASDNNLARSILPAARSVELRSHHAHPEDYVVVDQNREIIGVFPRDYVAAIMPIVTEGPGVTN